ncbi:MAG: ATP-binding protein, partial [Candidatus Omnitrophota bacterium]
ELELSRLDISELIKNVLLSFGFQLKQSKVEAANNIVSGTFVKADRDKIEQVMTNLIDNAIKFNKEGGFIKIIAEDLGSNLKVIVEDSGQGIPIKDAPRIFERFYRVDKARSRQLGGTGLGLSIVKHIIELHGGSVGLESTEGLGSKFWFILPK